MSHSSVAQLGSDLSRPRLHRYLRFQHELGEHQLNCRTERLHQIVNQRIRTITCLVEDSDLRKQSVNDKTPMTKRREDSVSVVQHLIRRSVFAPISLRRRPANRRKIELPIATRTIRFIKLIVPECQLQMRTAQL